MRKETSVCLQSPSLAPQPPAQTLSSQKVWHPGPGLLGEGIQGKGCGCKEESPVGAMNCSWGHLPALLHYGFLGCGGGQDLPGKRPTPSTAVDPLPSGFLGEGHRRGLLGAPCPHAHSDGGSTSSGGRAGVGWRKPDVRPAQLGTISHGSAAARSPSL